MIKNIECSNCHEKIDLKSDTLDFIKKAKEDKKTFIMLYCNNCGLDFSYNPQDNNKIQTIEKELVWKCPTSGCHGYVSFVDGKENEYAEGKNFYGCGETGNIWLEKENFYKDIEKIIKQYPYRGNCYTHVDKEWLPNDCDIDNIDELIDLEKDNRWDKPVRG